MLFFYWVPFFHFYSGRNNFSDSALLWTRSGGILGALLLFGYYIFRPLWHSPSKRQVARFLEEQYPQLEERVSTAVEIETTSTGVHPELRSLIQQDARQQLGKIPQPRLYHRRRSLASLAACSLLWPSLLSSFLKGPEVYPYSLTKLLRWFDQSQTPIYSIEVTPGNITVGKRSDLEIRATLKGFESETVELMVRYENQPQWEETSMNPDLQGGDFVFIFFDIRDPISYYVKADGIQSATYSIEVSEIPRVEGLKVILEFPDYTALENLTLDDGDIRALVGTQAELFIQTDQPVQSGKIKLEVGGEIPLEILSPQELRGVFDITQNDYYRIHLQDLEGFWNPASDEYLIEALEDQPPIVRFTRPGRDQRVTNIEEVFAEIKAEDDYGVSQLALRFSLNGEPEREAQLNYPKGSSSFSTSHTFYLEEFSLVPGDFVSYYAEASDAASSSSTDIYFFEVEPFDREYYQSQQSGMGGGGGQGENIDLSKRQKEIVAATFKLERDRDRQSKDEFEENSQTLALVQQRLQSEAQTIVDRMERRTAAVSDPRFQKMAEHLKKAITYMEPAHLHLNELETKEALPEEQKSLQQLMRAEALFNEIQVSFAQNQGGGGASAQDLADLVDLELDRTKNQYETLQQNRQTNREQALDEALEKLKELAKRQEQLVERHRQQGMQGSSGSMSQQELIDEAERVARELERLSRQQQDPQLQNISRNLRQAVRDMRQAQSSGQNDQEAQMRAQQALERLQEAQQGLGQQRRQQLTEDLQQLKEQSERLVKEQKDVLDQVGDIDETAKKEEIGPELIQQLRNVLRQKSQLQEDLQQLEGDLHQSARQMESRQTASRKLKQAALGIRDQRIPEKMEDGTNLLARGWTDLAKEREKGIVNDLEEMAERIREAEKALGSGIQETPREKLQRALNEVGNLVENLESLENRASGNDQEGQRGEQGEQGQQQGQQQGEQQGQQQGQQGQQGQPESQGSESAQGGQSRTGISRQAGMNPNASGVDPRQIGREWRERLEDAEELRGMMEGRPDLGRDVAGLIRRMRRLDAQRIFDDEAELARLRSQVIDGFRQLELELNRTLDEEVENLLRLVDGDEVPPEFRQRVEEYYRALANRRNPD